MDPPPSFLATLEGDLEAKEKIKELFSLPITFLEIKKENKLLYHSATLFASQSLLPLSLYSKPSL